MTGVDAILEGVIAREGGEAFTDNPADKGLSDHAHIGDAVTRPVPGLAIEEQPQGVVIRMLLWGEARGESVLGKLAVLWVVHNRAMKRDTTLKAEALRPLQFSCFNGDDPNRAKMLTAWQDDPVGWAVCDAVAATYEATKTVDPTEGATHYYVAKMKNPPAWGRGHAQWEETVELGAHVFGRTA